MFKQLIMKSAAIIGLSCLSTIAAAGNLIITNNTDEPSTTVTNGKCSTQWLGEGGITKPHEKRELKETQLRVACGKDHLDNCVADVYMTNNCTGPVIATVTLDTKKDGIKNVVVIPGGKYLIDAPLGGYSATMSYR